MEEGGGGASYREERQVKFYPYKKKRGGVSFSHAERRATSMLRLF